jgi:hypothetical protein
MCGGESISYVLGGTLHNTVVSVRSFISYEAVGKRLPQVEYRVTVDLQSFLGILCTAVLLGNRNPLPSRI